MSYKKRIEAMLDAGRPKPKRGSLAARDQTEGKTWTDRIVPVTVTVDVVHVLTWTQKVFDRIVPVTVDGETLTEVVESNHYTNHPFHQLKKEAEARLQKRAARALREYPLCPHHGCHVSVVGRCVRYRGDYDFTLQAFFLCPECSEF